jgi:hypothetical protein
MINLNDSDCQTKLLLKTQKSQVQSQKTPSITSNYQKIIRDIGRPPVSRGERGVLPALNAYAL